MSSNPHYPGAPIAEAALVIRVRSSANPESVRDWSLDDPAYPHRGRPARFKWEVKAEAEPVVSGGDSAAALQLTSDDKKQSFEVRAEGFTFSRFAPYDRWETFQPEARRLWLRYKELAKPDAIEGLALHYVNRLDVPVTSRLEEYFDLYVHVPERLPQDLVFCLAMVSFKLKDPDSVVNIALYSAPPVKENCTSVIIDANTYLPIGRPLDEDQMWALFEKMRYQKNFVFESCITNKVREMIR